MSDDISDKIDYVMAKKMGTYSRMTNELEVLGQLSGFTSGPEMDFFTAQRMKKMSYRNMSASEIFLDSVIKRDKLKYSITDEEFAFLVQCSNKLPYIQFKNPGGILYAYRYYKLVKGAGNIGSGKKDKITETKLKNFFTEAEELNVPTFDVFRYYRLLVEYKMLNNIETGIKINVDFSKGSKSE
jgi:hypothetical protein